MILLSVLASLALIALSIEVIASALTRFPAPSDRAVPVSLVRVVRFGLA